MKPAGWDLVKSTWWNAVLNSPQGLLQVLKLLAHLQQP
jgi:hypothetical protein